ncbi:MAG: toll/interleukin-1 receptor domain-containing protein [Anaerolineae bacterium]|nr:toll/interleukin-1 receptor domain-containing protein [Anaerolineae bacterium]
MARQRKGLAAMASEHFDLPDLIYRSERLSDLWRQAADWAAQELGIPSWLQADIDQLEESLRAPLQALIRFVGSLPDDPAVTALLQRLTENVDLNLDDESDKKKDASPIPDLTAQQTADTYAQFADLLKGLGFAEPPEMVREEAAPSETAEPEPVPTPLPPAQPISQPPPPAPQPQPPRGGEMDKPRVVPADRQKPAPTAATEAGEVHFSAYYPSRIGAAISRYALIVYAHLAELVSTIEADARKFAQELGGSVPPRTVANRSARLAANTPITITPECSDLVFDPPSLTKTWGGTWTRFNFDFTPKAALQSSAVTGRIAISVGVIEIAHIDFTMTVILNPLAAAKLVNSSAKLYQKIFVSYSRRDREIVDSYRAAQMALGNDVFVDTESIRSGQNWQAALATAIDNADIFQLFWSANSAASSNVRDEWDYALHYRCPQTQCADFLRPVYWQNPLTPPPAELNHLNFRYVPVPAKESDGFFQRLRKLFGSS